MTAFEAATRGLRGHAAIARDVTDDADVFDAVRYGHLTATRAHYEHVLATRGGRGQGQGRGARVSTPTGVAPLYTAPAPRESVRTKAGRGKWWIVGIGLIVLVAISVAVTSSAHGLPTRCRSTTLTGNGTRAMAQILRRPGRDTRRSSTPLARVSIADPSTTTLVIAGADILTRRADRLGARVRGRHPVHRRLLSSCMAAIDEDLDLTYDFLPETVDPLARTPTRSPPSACAWSTRASSLVGDHRRGPVLPQPLRRGRHGGGAERPRHPHGRHQPGRLLQRLRCSPTATPRSRCARRATTRTPRGTSTTTSTSRFSQAPAGRARSTSPPTSCLPGLAPRSTRSRSRPSSAPLWRGRRFGPLAVEPLPVVVRASEATRGRARLYRRARAYGRATAALRAASARAHRLPAGRAALHGSGTAWWRRFSAPPAAPPRTSQGFCTAPAHKRGGDDRRR